MSIIITIVVLLNFITLTISQLPSIKLNMTMDFNNDFIPYKNQWELDYRWCDSTITLCRIKLAKDGQYLSNVTTSESQSFGMLIYASLTQQTKNNSKSYFDALLRFAEMNPSSYDNTTNFTDLHRNDPLLRNTTSFMSWYYHDSFPNDLYGSSFGADANIAYALYLANTLFFSSSSVYYNMKYQDLVRKLVDLISPESFCPYLGDWVVNNTSLNSPYKLAIKPGDFLFKNFRAFVAVDSNTYWSILIQRQLILLLSIQEDWGHSVKLIPDYIQYLPETQTFTDVTGNILEGADKSYYLNSCLIPLRLASYLNVASSDVIALRVLFNILNYYITNFPDITKIPEAIDMNGKSVNMSGFNSQSTKLACMAPLAAAAVIDYDLLFGKDVNGLIAFRNKQVKYLNALENYIRNNHQGYYQDSVVLLSMLSMFRRT